MDFTVQKLRENFWAIDQKGVRAFLFAGSDSAILVDTCFGGELRALCETLTDKPITLISTHSDPDHIGADDQFPEHYLHEAELTRYRLRCGKEVSPKAVREGDLFFVGDYRLEVVWLPGHTPGSIALLDREKHFLISGDTVQENCIFMHGDGRDLKLFHESIRKLEAMRQEGIFDTVYASHGPACIPADILPEHLILAEEILGGNAVPVADAPDWFPDTVKTYGYGRVKMYY